MGKELISYISLRINVSKPQHSKIVKVMNNLNLDACKSKNQFIIDALEFYIDHYGDSTFSDNSNVDDNGFVKKRDLEKQLEIIKQEAAMEAKNEVIRQLGGILMNGAKTNIGNTHSESYWDTKDTEKALIDIALDYDNE